MLDRYSKFVLSIIACALVAIAIQQAIPRASALSSECGSPSNPCYIEAAGTYGLRVYVSR